MRGCDHKVQVAYAKSERERAIVSTIAICAGSGGSVLLGVEADVYFTGEMSHHEVLAAVQSGHNVILCKCCSLRGRLGPLSHFVFHRWPHKHRTGIPPVVGEGYRGVHSRRD